MSLLRSPAYFALVFLLSSSGYEHAQTPQLVGTAEPKTVSGPWQFESLGHGLSIDAGLVSAGSTVSGEATVYGCGAEPEQTRISGRTDGQGRVELRTTSLVYDTTLMFSGKLTADGLAMTGEMLVALGKCGGPRYGGGGGSRRAKSGAGASRWPAVISAVNFILPKVAHSLLSFSH